MKIKFNKINDNKINHMYLFIEYKNQFIFMKKDTYLEIMCITNTENKSTDELFFDITKFFFNVTNLIIDTLFAYEDNSNETTSFGIVCKVTLEDISLLIIDNYLLVDSKSASKNFISKDKKIFNKVISFTRLYYIYILRCQGQTLYTGIATDYKERFKKHKKGLGAKYTKLHPPLFIESVWSIEGRSNATKVELYIKSLNKKQKEDLIKNPLLLRNVFLTLNLVD